MASVLILNFQITKDLPCVRHYFLGFGQNFVVKLLGAKQNNTGEIQILCLLPVCWKRGPLIRSREMFVHKGRFLIEENYLRN